MRLPIFLLVICSASTVLSNDLIRYFHREIELTDQEIQALITQTFNYATDDFELAMAYFQSGVQKKKIKRYTFAELKEYSEALKHYMLSEQVDSKFEFYLYNNMGLIMKNAGYYKEASEFHQVALQAAEENGDKEFILKALMNYATAISKFDPIQSIPLFHEARMQAEELEDHN